MIQTCARCGYTTDHIKHYQGCNIPKNQWPSAYLRSVGETASGQALVQPMPAVTVLVAEPSGIRRVPLGHEAPLPAVAATTLPAGGACCRHPEQQHVADVEGFPPTCLGCPDDNDEHVWQPVDVVNRLMAAALIRKQSVDSEFAPARTITSPPSVVCDCGFLARSAGTLRTHRAKAKIHQVTSA